MKERPILFNAEMVRAILDGRKTQTRRVIKLDHERGFLNPVVRGHGGEVSSIYSGLAHMLCPLGNVGEQLWVRETFRVHSRASDVATLVYRASERNSWTEQTRRVPVSSCNRPVSPEAWTPSIHMPRWASRIDLLITSVRVERLNSITNADAKAEGYPAEREIDGGSTDPWLWFRDLWDGIYPDNTFKVNPCVWVIEFERVAPTGERS